jgi:hypothetical protein
MKENATIAAVYNNKSIAEQNSLDIGTSNDSFRIPHEVTHTSFRMFASARQRGSC